MINRSKSSLFLIEQLVTIAVFAICAVACLKIISTAYFYSRDSRDVSFATITAKYIAEVFKEAPEEFITAMADYTLYFDSDWRRTHSSDAPFIAVFESSNITVYPSHSLIEGNISVKRANNDELIALNVAAILRAGQGGEG